MGLFICLIILLSTKLADLKDTHDTLGREFMVAFMENYQAVGPLELMIMSVDEVLTDVNISVVIDSGVTLKEHFSMSSQSYKSANIGTSFRLKASELKQKGIYIESDYDVMVYGVNNEYNSNDVFHALPVNVLGTEYFVVTYFPPTRKCQLAVVGVYDDTQVNITLSDNDNAANVEFQNVIYKKGDLITLTVNKYDALQIQSNGDLTGSYISSSKHVSVFSGNFKTKTGNTGSSQDHLVVQLTPIDTWGKTFVTMPTPERATGDIFRIVSSRPGTTVNYTCSNNGNPVTKSFSLQDAGDVNQRIITSSDFCSFVADLPIMIVQILVSMDGSKDKGDPSMVLIPSILQYSSMHSFATPYYAHASSRQFDKHYFMFAIEKDHADGLRFDGNKLPDNTQYTDIPNSGFVGGYISVSHGYHIVNHVSPSVTFEGIAYGKINHESFAMVTGRKVARINKQCKHTPQTPGDGKDNDCDGLLDEENCHNTKTGDDDGDGLYNEDCAPVVNVVKISSSKGRQWQWLPDISIPVSLTMSDVTVDYGWSCGVLCYKEDSCLSYSFDHTNQRCRIFSKNYLNYDTRLNKLLDRSRNQDNVQYFYTSSQLEESGFTVQNDLSLCYKLHTTKKNKVDAEKTCAQEDSRLILINSAEQLLSLQKLFIDTPILSTEASVFTAGYYYKGRWEYWNDDVITNELWETNGRNEHQGHCVSMTRDGLKSEYCHDLLYFICGK